MDLSAHRVDDRRSWAIGAPCRGGRCEGQVGQGPVENRLGSHHHVAERLVVDEGRCTPRRGRHVIASMGRINAPSAEEARPKRVAVR